MINFSRYIKSIITVIDIHINHIGLFQKKKILLKFVSLFINNTLMKITPHQIPKSNFKILFCQFNTCKETELKSKKKRYEEEKKKGIIQLIFHFNEPNLEKRKKFITSEKRRKCKIMWFWN